MSKANRPKITIVTVVYNAKRYLEQTIKSIVEQDYPSIEYIVIDGNSSDGTVDIIKKYEKYISYWISESDRGIYDAMNKGIDNATGEWINFMNAGDTFAGSKTLEMFIDSLEPQSELYCGAINFINEKTGIGQYRKPHTNEKIWETVTAWHQGTFIKTDLMKEYRYTLQYKIAGDHEFLVRCYVDAKKFQFSDLIIANMMDGGLHQQENKLAYLESMKIIADYAPDIDLIYQSDFYKQLRSNSTDNSNLEFSERLNILSRQAGQIQQKYSKIALIGYGHVAKYLENILDNVVVATDKMASPNLYSDNTKFPIIPLTRLFEYNFDVAVITILGREDLITNDLLQLGARKEQIITFDLKS